MSSVVIRTSEPEPNPLIHFAAATENLGGQEFFEHSQCGFIKKRLLGTVDDHLGVIDFKTSLLQHTLARAPREETQMGAIQNAGRDIFPIASEDQVPQDTEIPDVRDADKD